MQNSQYFGTPPLKPSYKRQAFTLGAKDFVFALFAFISCFLVSRIGLMGEYRLGFSISCFIVFAMFTCFFWNKRSYLSPFTVFCGLSAPVLCGVYYFSSNPTVNFFATFYIFFSSSVWFCALARGKKYANRDLALPFLSAASSFGIMFGSIDISVYSLFTQKKKGSSAAKIAIGAACTLPVLLIVVPLLVSSDEAFAGLIGSIIGDIGKTVFSVIMGAIGAVLLISYGFGLKHSNKINIKPLKKRPAIDSRATCAFFAVLGMVYLLYLFSQLAYFFSAFSGILPKGYSFTAAEYARRGFFEMTAIAAINFVLCAAGIFTMQLRENGKKPKFLCALLAFISIFTLMLVACAASKMVLYIGRFGLTQMRIFTSAFLILLFVTFAALLLRCFITKIHLVRISCICAALLLITLGFGNINKAVAVYNTEQYLSGNLEELDVETLGNSGYAAVPYLLRVYDINNEYREPAFNELYNIFNLLYDTGDETGTVKGKEYTSFPYLNSDIIDAYNAFEKYFKNNPDFKKALAKCSDPLSYDEDATENDGYDYRDYKHDYGDYDYYDDSYSDNTDSDINIGGDDPLGIYGDSENYNSNNKHKENGDTHEKSDSKSNIFANDVVA